VFATNPKALLLLLPWALACHSGSEPPSESAPRNLLLISLDTVRADHLGIYGDDAAATASLDRIGREGARFTAASSAVPLTLPSHATLMTGLLPPQHGLRINGLGELPAQHLTLAEHLSSAGYDTAAFVSAFVLDHRFGLGQGFALYDDEVQRALDGESPRLEAERPANVVIDKALSWLSSRKSASARPFFLFVHLYDAHAPYLPPEPWRTRFADRPYDGEIAFADHELGRLLGELEKRGELDSTLIAVVADHGESLGEHGEATHGLLLYESSLHIPLLLRAPEIVPKGLTIEAPVGLVDLAPTLAALLGHPFPAPEKNTAGRDLSPLLLGEAMPEHVIYAETEYPATFGWSPLAAARQGNLKLIASSRPKLFDLRSDPHETEDRKEEERRSFRFLMEKVEEIRTNPFELAAGASSNDDEARRRLASLGYVSSSGRSPKRSLGQGADPEERMADFHRWEKSAAQIRSSEPATALAELESLVAGDPGNPVFRTSLARLARHLGRYDQALELYRRAITDAPQDPDAWQDLAATFYEAGKTPESADAAGQALALDPSRPEALTLLALAEVSAGKAQLAWGHFTRVLELDPRNAKAHANRGNLLRAQGELAAAETEYRRALEVAPELVDAFNGLGTLMVETDRPQEAIALFERALSLEENFEEARLNLGIAKQLAGDPAGARRVFEELLRRTKGSNEHAAERSAAIDLLGLKHQ